MSERGGKFIDRLIKSISSDKMGERGREMGDCLVEFISKDEMSDGGREGVGPHCG